MKPLYWLCGPRLKNSDSTFNKNIYKNKDKCKLYYSKFFGVAINVNKIVFYQRMMSEYVVAIVPVRRFKKSKILGLYMNNTCIIKQKRF